MFRVAEPNTPGSAPGYTPELVLKGAHSDVCCLHSPLSAYIIACSTRCFSTAWADVSGRLSGCLVKLLPKGLRQHPEGACSLSSLRIRYSVELSCREKGFL